MILGFFLVWYGNHWLRCRRNKSPEKDDKTYTRLGWCLSKNLYKHFLFCECCTFMTILLYFIEIVFESSFRFIWGLRCIKSEDRLKPNQWKENMDSAPHPILNKYLSIFNIFKISIGHFGKLVTVFSTACENLLMVYIYQKVHPCQKNL